MFKTLNKLGIILIHVQSYMCHKNIISFSCTLYKLANMPYGASAVLDGNRVQSNPVKYVLSVNTKVCSSIVD